MGDASGGVVEVRPATAARFDEVAAVLAPKRPDAPGCWCLALRLPSAENRVLTGLARPARLRRECGRTPPPGVVATVDGQPAGWCSVGPRSGIHRLTRSRTIPVVDDIAVWSVHCFVVRPGHRRRGLCHELLAGAVELARSHGAPVVEGYPVEAPERRISSTLAHVGTTSLFEAAGFERVVATASSHDGARRWLVRRWL